MKSSGPGSRVRLAVGLAAAGVTLWGGVTPAYADAVADARACRGAIAKSSRNVAKNALKYVDNCHKAQSKLDLGTGACNVVAPGVAPFDPKIKYAAYVTKQADGIAKKCFAGNVALDNYPGQDADAAVFPIIEQNAGGNSILTRGGEDLNLDKALIKCNGAIGKERAKVFDEIVKESIKCQGLLDKVATTFAGLDPTCVRTAVKAGPKAALNIQKACIDTALDPVAVGTCSPLPACVIDTTTLAAQEVASALYQVGNPTCGNGVLEFPEQCDDGNTTDADGCSSVCETEGGSCDAVPGSSVIGGRTVTIALDVPGAQKLAGVQLTLDYPQFQAGIPGSGQSSIVAGAVSLLQDTTVPGDYQAIFNDKGTDMAIVIGATEAFMDDGDLLAVAMDACVAKELNLCNRNQNVIGCCNAATDTDGDTVFQECADFAAPPACSAFSVSGLNTGTPEDCCPADNACITQADATACSVGGAADELGQPVDGVTCTAVITGM